MYTRDSSLGSLVRNCHSRAKKYLMNCDCQPRTYFVNSVGKLKCSRGIKITRFGAGKEEIANRIFVRLVHVFSVLYSHVRVRSCTRTTNIGLDVHSDE